MKPGRKRTEKKDSEALPIFGKPDANSRPPDMTSVFQRAGVVSPVTDRNTQKRREFPPGVFQTRAVSGANNQYSPNSFSASRIRPTQATRFTHRGLSRLAIFGPMKPARMAAGNMAQKSTQSKLPNW